MAEYITSAEAIMNKSERLKKQSLPQSLLLHVVSPWCNSVWKRVCDILGSILLLIVFLPVMIFIALAVKLTSPGPILYRQRRPGVNGREFFILKFRTMQDGRRLAGPVLTRAEDPRVTWFGRHIRKWKLDELPQLFNVLRGEMSFVGPRPQPTKLWNEPAIRDQAAVVLSVRPGITSQATLNFRNEEELLAPLSSEELEEVYVRSIMPLKLRMDVEYLREASFGSDLSLILRTTLRIFNRQEENNQVLLRRPPVPSQREYQPVVEQSD
jgi:lipopolysaccharide/colanic/teichoic acid biosynthesis glycosyltransferase